MLNKQPLMPMQTYNKMALFIFKENVTKLKSMDMKFHWLWCRKNQGYFRHFWGPGIKNKGDYMKKHHAEIQQQAIIPALLTLKCQLQLLRKRAEWGNPHQGYDRQTVI